MLVLAGISLTWSRFSSTTYPYTMEQPSDFSHIVTTIGGHQRDYFSPALGSYTTNVNVYAVLGESAGDLRGRLRQEGGKKVGTSGSVDIMGHSRTLVRASFNGLAGHWSIEQMCFTAHGMTWYLTMSFDDRYRHLRPVMLRMLHSFRVRT